MFSHVLVDVRRFGLEWRQERPLFAVALVPVQALVGVSHVGQCRREKRNRRLRRPGHRSHVEGDVFLSLLRFEVHGVHARPQTIRHHHLE